jgi:hypothetical protein
MRSHQQQYALIENHPLRLTWAKGHRVECVSGRVWITAYNEGGDIELTAGQQFIIPNHGLALVEAIGTAAVRTDKPNLAADILVAMLAAGKLKLRRALAVPQALAGALGLGQRD